MCCCSFPSLFEAAFCILKRLPHTVVLRSLFESGKCEHIWDVNPGFSRNLGDRGLYVSPSSVLGESIEQKYVGIDAIVEREC